MSANGRLKASELTLVQRGSINIYLANATARAWSRLKAEYERTHPGERLTIAAPVGGYRSYAIQADMHVRPWLYGLSSYSTVPLAPAGYSTHGDGRAVDIAGASTAGHRKTWLLDNAARFGFRRQFGENDPNHYKHDGVTAAGGGAPISTKENTMPAVIKRTEGTPEWSLVHPALVGTSDLERGYIVTSDPIRGKWWARLYDDGAGNEQGFERADYIEMQANARKDHEAWVGSSSTPAGPSAADVAAEIAKLIPPAPTAEDVAAAVAALPHPTYTATPNA